MYVRSKELHASLPYLTMEQSCHFGQVPARLGAICQGLRVEYLGYRPTFNEKIDEISRSLRVESRRETVETYFLPPIQRPRLKSGFTS